MKSRERIAQYLRQKKRGALPPDPALEQDLTKLAERSDAPQRRASKRPTPQGERR